MNKFISSRVNDLQFSGIRKFFDVAATMEDVVSLGVGEPDFLTPWTIREEAIYSLEKRRTNYSSNAGLYELRKEISKYTEETIGVTYNPDNEICVTVGGSEGIDITLRTILDIGDEVLVVEPSYVSYVPCIVLAGGVAVSVTTSAENGFKVTKEDIESKITSKTKAILISYPNNPTGAIATKKDLEEIAEVIIKHDLFVISDEIYAELTYDENVHFSIAQLPGMFERTVVLNGFSKSFSMTGWRLGYAMGPKDIMAHMVKVHQYVIMCAPTISQYAGIEALKNARDEVEKMRYEYSNRRLFLVDGLRKLGLNVNMPEGAFYVFPSIEKTNLKSEEFCEKLLFQERLAVVPGNAFGESGEGFVRCSYAYKQESLAKALERMDKFLNSLK